MHRHRSCRGDVGMAPGWHHAIKISINRYSALDMPNAQADASAAIAAAEEDALSRSRFATYHRWARIPAEVASQQRKSISQPVAAVSLRHSPRARRSGICARSGPAAWSSLVERRDASTLSASRDFMKLNASSVPGSYYANIAADPHNISTSAQSS